MAMTTSFNLISNENAIIPNIILRTMQDIEHMLKELKIAVKNPIIYSSDDIKNFANLNPWLDLAYNIADTIDPSLLGNTTKTLDDATQCSVFDPEIVVDKQFMQSVSDSFSQCSAMNARINQKLDELDEIMSKSIDISRYTKDEKAVLTQVQTIYETLHSTLQSIIDNVNGSTDTNSVIGRGITSLIDRIDKYANDYGLDNDDNDSNKQDNTMKIDSSKYGDNIRTRKRVYMRWINSLKDCMDSIQNIIGSNTLRANHAKPTTPQPNQTQSNTQAQNTDEKLSKESNKDIQPHQRNPFL
ncbi:MULTISPECIES: hypothetical protein [Helicobacter]|uniref:Uncharacterized protein n=1 Tax=Helicobacter bilis ATCC 43879 TaxID=613026 RepID=C3XFH4_9HELI|nr:MULTISPECIES: hypothetical protein [Helicobacter]EEO23763.1 hypothetical protein HRAG_00820 [Helicobacter bilis ATCC 43879]